MIQRSNDQQLRFDCSRSATSGVRCPDVAARRSWSGLCVADRDDASVHRNGDDGFADNERGSASADLLTPTDIAVGAADTVNRAIVASDHDLITGDNW